LLLAQPAMPAIRLQANSSLVMTFDLRSIVFLGTGAAHNVPRERPS